MIPWSHMHKWWIHIMWEVELARSMQDPSSFTLCLPEFSQSLVPSRAVVLCSPLGLSINAFRRGSFFTPQSLAGSQNWVSSTTSGQRVTFGDCLHTLFKGTRAKDRTTWELIRGWVFWFIPLLLAEPIFCQPPLYGGFSPVYTWGWHDLS